MSVATRSPPTIPGSGFSVKALTRYVAPLRKGVAFHTACRASVRWRCFARPEGHAIIPWTWTEKGLIAFGGCGAA